MQSTLRRVRKLLWHPIDSSSVETMGTNNVVAIVTSMIDPLSNISYIADNTATYRITITCIMCPRQLNCEVKSAAE